MLQCGRDREGREDDEKDKDVVDGERLLNDVAGEKLERTFHPEPDVDPDVESQGQGNPNGRPHEGLSDAHGVCGAVEDTEIECQHGQDEQGEADPQERRADTVDGHGQLLALAPRLTPPAGWH